MHEKGKCVTDTDLPEQRWTVGPGHRSEDSRYSISLVGSKMRKVRITL